MTVRTPPRPPFEHARPPWPLVNGKRKRPCPMCGEPDPRPRATWHPACVELWRYAAFPEQGRALLVDLHGRICWGCGRREQPWGDGVRPVVLEYEHTRPLWSLTAAERLELRWWLPYNLQLLCRWCHREKTAREAADRYARDYPEGTLATRRRVAAMSPELWP